MEEDMFAFCLAVLGATCVGAVWGWRAVLAVAIGQFIGLLLMAASEGE